MKKRIEQINELIKREVGAILLREIPFPEGCLVTITRVETMPDLKEARIFITIFPEDKTEEILKRIKNQIGHLQFLLNKRLFMRPLPRIVFMIDEVEKEAQKIEAIINKINIDKK